MTVFIVLYQDEGEHATVLGVYTELTQANGKCIGTAGKMGMTLSIVEESVSKDSELMRWDTAGGISCWVEGHKVHGQGEYEKGHTMEYGRQEWGEVQVREEILAVIE